MVTNSNAYFLNEIKLNFVIAADIQFKNSLAIKKEKIKMLCKIKKGLNR
jgi:hypothetical protein